MLTEHPAEIVNEYGPVPPVTEYITLPELVSAHVGEIEIPAVMVPIATVVVPVLHII